MTQYSTTRPQNHSLYALHIKSRHTFEGSKDVA